MGRWDLGSAGVFGFVSARCGVGGYQEGEPGCGAVHRTGRRGREAIGSSTGARGCWCQRGMWGGGFGYGEELGLRGWSWRKGGSVAVGLGCGDLEVLGMGRHKYRSGREHFWPHCWDVLNLGRG